MSCGCGECAECKSKKIPKGPKGATGATGATGPKGLDGNKGATGATGAAAVLLPGFYASVIPASIPIVASVAPYDGQTITGYTEVYDDDAIFDPATGIWNLAGLVPALTTGRYDLSASCKLTIAGTWGGGRCALGIIIPSLLANVYSADFQITDASTTIVSITTIRQGILLNSTLAK